MELRGTTRRLLCYFVCLLCAALLFSCAGSSDAQTETQQPMMVTLNILDLSEKAPVSVKLGFTLHNDTANRYEVLKWGTPFEGEFNDNMFDVTRDDQPLPYLGRQFKRGAPQKEDFIEMAPHGELSTSLLLENGYAVNQPGHYTVQYRKPYLTLRDGQGEEQLRPIMSNRVEFDISR